MRKLRKEKSSIKRRRYKMNKYLFVQIVVFVMILEVVAFAGEYSWSYTEPFKQAYRENGGDSNDPECNENGLGADMLIMIPATSTNPLFRYSAFKDKIKEASISRIRKAVLDKVEDSNSSNPSDPVFKLFGINNMKIDIRNVDFEENFIENSIDSILCLNVDFSTFTKSSFDINHFNNVDNSEITTIPLVIRIYLTLEKKKKKKIFLNKKIKNNFCFKFFGICKTETV
jgi:hypothetical protein